MVESALRENVVELLKAGHAHVALKDALEGLLVENRHVKPAAGTHSVWEELEHMRIAQEDILKYTLDPSWKSPKWPDGYWPQETSLTEAIWNKTVDGFLKDLNELVQLAQNTQIDLTAKIPHGEGRTYLREILLAADHNAYHLGQIVQARRLLGDWGS
jgi:uncharacterized damage-inducible protein DinB